MRRIGVVTVARSDYGIYLPLLKAIQADSELELVIIAGGMHLEAAFGYTVEMIENDGFVISERVPMDLSSDGPGSIAEAIGRGVSGYAGALSRNRPDILVVLGDRFDMYAAAVAALPLNIPVAHIHGGEVTEGAIDDALRHSMTKLSHWHFVSTGLYAQRVVQMGEPPDRVTVTGAPGLDHLRNIEILNRKDLEENLGFSLGDETLLVTFHPVTLEYEETAGYTDELLDALEVHTGATLFTLPNADTHGRIITAKIKEFVDRHETAHLEDNLGTRKYFSLMNQVSAMVGNSSSGIIEAASFKLPVVNIGTRQKGRVRAGNVIDVGYGKDDIVRGIEKALSKKFRDGLRDLLNPYGDGTASGKIVEQLKKVDLNGSAIKKSFFDWPDLDLGSLSHE